MPQNTILAERSRGSTVNGVDFDLPNPDEGSTGPDTIPCTLYDITKDGDRGFESYQIVSRHLSTHSTESDSNTFKRGSGPSPDPREDLYHFPSTSTSSKGVAISLVLAFFGLPNHEILMERATARRARSQGQAEGSEACGSAKVERHFWE